jgi:hypothetical protein
VPQPFDVVPIACPVPVRDVHACGPTPPLARLGLERVPGHQLRVTSTADPDAASVEVVHVADAAVTAACHDDLRADEPHHHAGGLRAAEAANARW